MAELVRTRGLTKRFGHVSAIADLDLDVHAGEVLGVLGPNGAGKTTLIRLLLGMLRPTSGHAFAFGLDVTRDAAHAHRRMAYVPGETALWPGLTGGQTLELLGNLHGTVDTAYRDQLVRRFDLDPAVRVRAYSKGNRQKVSLVAALATRADLLVLDEPTSGLDPLMEQVFRDCIGEARGRGQTVLLSSHELGEVERLCDRVAILRAGRLADLGTLAELRHLETLQMEITFAGEVPDLSAVPGVTGVRAAGGRLTCTVHGPLAPLLGVLSRCQVVSLVSREPSLEEIFLAHYGTAARVASHVA